MEELPFIILVSGLVLAILSLPLMFRKIPMNRFYGIRLPASFQSPSRWYEINAYGGRWLFFSSLMIILWGAVGIGGMAEKSWYQMASVVILMLAIFAPLVLTIIWIRRKGLK